MLRQSPKHLISTTTRHPSQHSTTRQRCLHTGLIGLGWAEGKPHRTFISFKIQELMFSRYWRKANVLRQRTLRHAHGRPCPVSRLGREMLDTCSTLLEHCLTVLMSS